MSKINFYFHDRSPSIKGKKRLKIFIEQIFKHEKKKLRGLSYIFCSDKHLLSINKQFLNHDFYTDVITFDLSSSNNEIEGEVYISADRVKDNAEAAGDSFVEELHRVIFHGALHLCGFKDKRKADQRKMRQTEDKYLWHFFHVEHDK